MLFLLGTVALGLLGAGLAVNCALGLLSGEGKWDHQSSRIMFWSQLLGIFVGLLLFLRMVGAVTGTVFFEPGST